MRHLKLFEEQINNFDEHLPNKEMVEWYEMETKYIIDDTDDELESDIKFSKIQQNFLETFSDELSNLNYFEKLDIFVKLYL